MLAAMPRRALALFLTLAALALLLGACDPPSARGLLGQTISCQKDADCHPPSCGPCIPGAELINDPRECVVNPCPDAKVACSPRHVCVVKEAPPPGGR